MAAIIKSTKIVDTIRFQYDPDVVSKTDTSTYVRVGDTEANILAKLYTFLINDQQDKKRLEKKQKEVTPTLSPTTATKTKSSNLFNSGMVTAMGMLGIIGVGAGLFVFSDEIKAKIDELKSAFDTTEIGNVFDKIRNMFDFSDYFGETYTGEDIGYDQDEAGAKASAEKYLGRSISDKEWDQLIRATHAESGSKTNVKEEGLILGTVLNRARAMGGEDSITKVLQQKNQFQAVTGTEQAPGPSEQYRAGPSSKRKESIIYAAKNVLPAVSRRQTQFTAASASAYGAGTNIGYRDKMISAGGQVVGGTVFNTELSPIPTGLLSMQQPSGVGTGPDLTFAPGVDQRITPVMADRAQAIQNIFGKRLTITSGYRDPERNKDVGGATQSAHLTGNAIDVDVSGMTHDERLKLIRIASALGIGGIGIYANSLHFDVLGRRAWGSSYSASSIPNWANGVVSEHLSGNLLGSMTNIQPIETVSTASSIARSSPIIPSQVKKKLNNQSSVVYIQQNSNQVFNQINSVNPSSYDYSARDIAGGLFNTGKH